MKSDDELKFVTRWIKASGIEVAILLTGSTSGKALDAALGSPAAVGVASTTTTIKVETGDAAKVKDLAHLAEQHGLRYFRLNEPARQPKPRTLISSEAPVATPEVPKVTNGVDEAFDADEPDRVIAAVYLPEGADASSLDVMEAALAMTASFGWQDYGFIGPPAQATPRQSEDLRLDIRERRFDVLLIPQGAEPPSSLLERLHRNDISVIKIEREGRELRRLKSFWGDYVTAEGKRLVVPPEVAAGRRMFARRQMRKRQKSEKVRAQLRRLRQQEEQEFQLRLGQIAFYEAVHADRRRWKTGSAQQAT